MIFREAKLDYRTLKEHGKPHLTIKVKPKDYIEIEGSYIFFDKFDMGQFVIHVSSQKELILYEQNRVKSKSDQGLERVVKKDKDVIVITRSPTIKLDKTKKDKI